MIIQTDQIYLGEQVIVLGIPGSNVVQTILKARFSELMPAPKSEEFLPAAGMDQAIEGAQRIAIRDQTIEPRAPAGVGMKIDVDLLGGLPCGCGGLDAGVIETVPLEQVSDPRNRRGSVAGRVTSAQGEFGSHQQLAFVGGLANAVHVEVSNEIRGLGDER